VHFAQNRPEFGPDSLKVSKLYLQYKSISWNGLCLLWRSLSFDYVHSAGYLVQTANRFINSLTTEQQKRCSTPYDEERFNWHFVPRTIVKAFLWRTEWTTKKSGFRFVGHLFKQRGMQHVTDIIQLENVLKQLEGRAIWSLSRCR